MLETIFFIGVFVIIIVVIQTIGDLVRRRYQFENRTDVNQETLLEIQADLKMLQKSVAEMQEYLTDLYIQQHDKD